MKELLCVFLVLLLSAGYAASQNDELGLYADPAAADCNIFAVPGLVSFYVVYTGAMGMKVISFSAPKPSCMADAIFIGDEYNAIYIVPPGNSQDGITLTHFTCEPAPVFVMTVNYFLVNPPPSCCYYAVFPHPDSPSGLIEAWDCGDNIFYPGGMVSTVNGDASCPCPAPWTVPTDATTWGRVKALYGE